MSPIDYDSVSTILTFDACSTQQCTEIPIVNGMRVEQTESFFLTLEGTPDLDRRITLGPVNGMVAIWDDDGMYYTSE